MIIKTKVNAETIEGLNDEQLATLVYKKASDLDCNTFGEAFKNTDNDILLCEVFSTFIVDAQVSNGGFDQYFYNRPDLVRFSINGLKKIGAIKHANLLVQAAEVYEKQKEEFKDERNPNLDIFDEEYYALEDFYSLQQTFIRENIERFFD